MTQIRANRLEYLDKDSRLILMLKKFIEKPLMSNSEFNQISRFCGISEIEIMTYFAKDVGIFEFNNWTVSLGENGKRIFEKWESQLENKKHDSWSGLEADKKNQRKPRIFDKDFRRKKI